MLVVPCLWIFIDCNRANSSEGISSWICISQMDHGMLVVTLWSPHEYAFYRWTTECWWLPCGLLMNMHFTDGPRNVGGYPVVSSWIYISQMDHGMFVVTLWSPHEYAFHRWTEECWWLPCGLLMNMHFTDGPRNVGGYPVVSVVFYTFSVLMILMIWDIFVLFFQILWHSFVHPARNSQLIRNLRSFDTVSVKRCSHLRSEFGFIFHNLTQWGLNKMADILQITLLNAFSWWKLLNFKKKFTEICSSASDWEYINIGAGDGLVPGRRQAIFWSSVHQDVWPHVVSLGHNQLSTLAEKTCSRSHLWVNSSWPGVAYMRPEKQLPFP